MIDGAVALIMALDRAIRHEDDAFLSMTKGGCCSYEHNKRASIAGSRVRLPIAYE